MRLKQLENSIEELIDRTVKSSRDNMVTEIKTSEVEIYNNIEKVIESFITDADINTLVFTKMSESSTTLSYSLSNDVLEAIHRKVFLFIDTCEYMKSVGNRERFVKELKAHLESVGQDSVQRLKDAVMTLDKGKFNDLHMICIIRQLLVHALIDFVEVCSTYLPEYSEMFLTAHESKVSPPSFSWKTFHPSETSEPVSIEEDLSGKSVDPVSLAVRSMNRNAKKAAEGLQASVRTYVDESSKQIRSIMGGLMNHVTGEKIPIVSVDESKIDLIRGTPPPFFDMVWQETPKSNFISGWLHADFIALVYDYSVMRNMFRERHMLINFLVSGNTVVADSIKARDINIGIKYGNRASDDKLIEMDSNAVVKGYDKLYNDMLSGIIREFFRREDDNRGELYPIYQTCRLYMLMFDFTSNTAGLNAQARDYMKRKLRFYPNAVHILNNDRHKKNAQRIADLSTPMSYNIP